MWNQLLKSSDTGLNSEQKKSINMIQEAVQYGQKLLRKMIDLENMIPDEIIIDQFDLGTFLSAIVKNAETLDGDFYWQSEISTPTYLWSERTLIKKMFEAILSSVLSNTKQNGKIKVSLRQENSEIVFQIKNDAIDISKNRLPGLYSDYKEIFAGNIEEYEISKLAIAQRIAEELNGNISTENDDGTSIISVRFKD